MGYRVQYRRDTAARWAEINPILLDGEIGYVKDNPNQYKMGDGIHAWNDLPLRGFDGTIAPTLGYNDDAVLSQRIVTEKFDEQDEKLSKLGSEVSDIKGGEKIISIVLPNAQDGYYNASGNQADEFNSDGKKYKIDLSQYIGNKVQIEVYNAKSGSSRYTFMGNDSKLVDRNQVLAEAAFVSTPKVEWLVEEEYPILYISSSVDASISVRIKTTGTGALPKLEERVSKNENSINDLNTRIGKLDGENIFEKIELPVAQDGYYNASGNQADEFNSDGKKYKIDLSQYIGNKVQIEVYNAKSGSSRYTFMGNDSKLVDRNQVLAEAAFVSTPKVEWLVEEEYPILYISSSVDAEVYVFIGMAGRGTIKNLETKVELNTDGIEALNKSVYGYDKNEEIPLSNEVSNYYFDTSGSVAKKIENVGSKLYDLIDLTNNIGNYVAIKFVGGSSGSTRGCAMVNSNYTVGYRTNESEIVKNGGMIELPVTDRYPYLILSHGSSVSSVKVYSLTHIKGVIDGKPETLFVAVDGNDENNGSISKPLLSVTKAIELGASKVVIGEGIYRERIDLTKAYGHIEISAANNGINVVFDGTTLLATESILVNGTTRVFRSEYTQLLSSALRWIFQKGKSDESTLISDEERNALQRGLQYRCEHTTIKRCSSTSLEEALVEIENAEGWLWYQDTNTYELYFSSPIPVTEEHSILCGTYGDNLFINPHRGVSLSIIGIQTFGQVFNVSGLTNVDCVDCKSIGVFDYGGFKYDNTLDCRFLRCEAALVNCNGNGDGFNGHSSFEGEANAKTTTCTIIDCWSHDNADDGYSDHERSETTIIGGLYEHCGKAGITPSYGSHCTCYNVISRNNGSGFYYIGIVEEEEGGIGGQVSCHNCIAESNIHSGYRVSGQGNRMYLVNCISLNNRYGYNPEGGTKIKCVDCKTFGDERAVYNNSSVEIINTNFIE